MNGLSKITTIILVVIAMIDLALFSNMTILTLVAYLIGVLGMTLGIQFSYRSASVFGLFIIGTAAAASMEFATVLQVSPLLAAISGLMIPMFVLTWTAFSVNEQGHQDIGSSRRGIAASVFYAGVVLASAPVISFFMSFLLPTVTTRFSTVTEISIMMVVLITSGILLTTEKIGPRASTGSEEEAASKQEPVP